MGVVSGCLAVRADMPVSQYLGIATGTAKFVFGFISGQPAFGAACPAFFLHSAAAHARELEFVLAEGTLDEVFRYRIAALAAKFVVAGGIR
jgi:hypothetical protein